ncbi:hypothetical protein T265_11368 [Opisthorchis viverrini]|uniref:Uncharacterized protein n=1 Tax=Opisthorchis viverrini TaxID=6198 RepID=A0A074Z9Q8_OPIVI|nr:hypothetical protein T265_11368 [Opisthorchis viverrini]KER19980.1 hypothetical protein T265_11368 [Opisthorchis viverrini]
MTHKSSGELKTTVHRKPADSGAILDYSSAHPKAVSVRQNSIQIPVYCSQLGAAMAEKPIPHKIGQSSDRFPVPHHVFAEFRLPISYPEDIISRRILSWLALYIRRAVQRNNSPSVDELITLHRLRWLDHVPRISVDRLPRRALFAPPREGYKRGG